jgi:hypothetical protein
MNINIEYDTAEPGLRAVLKDYQELALRAIWANPEGLGSKAVWDRVNEELKPNTISRASVINFLEAMREAGVLKGEEKTGKGGHHWIYSPSMNEAEFKQFIAETILKNLMRNFPEETRGGPRKLRALESPPNTNPKGTQICPHTPQCTNQVDLNPFRFKSGPAHFIP